MLGLDPDRVVERVRAEGRPFVLPTLRQTVTVGTVGFMIVGLVGFCPWAFGGRELPRALGTVGYYSLIALILFGGGAVVLKPIIIGRNLSRFAVVFGVGFTLLSAAWIVGYALRLPYRLGEFGGLLVGTVLLALTIIAAFRASHCLVAGAVALVAGHVGGYVLADRLFSIEALHNQYGMLLWGLIYGAGLGSGLSVLLFLCQAEVRKRLTQLVRGAVSDQGDH